jgi:hypothetical protein
MIRLAVMALALILTAASVLVALRYGQAVPMSEQWPLYEALRTTASIIFAVVGAWLAIIYPERLRLSFRGDSSTPSSAPVRLGKLLHPAIHSTAILCIVLVAGLFVPIFRHLPELLPYRDELRGVSYAFLVLLTLWQAWTVIMTLVPADMIKATSDAEMRNLETVAGYKRKSTDVNQH